MNRYFVFKGEDQPYYRAYGTCNFIEPAIDDSRCIWRGDDYKIAKEIAKQANKKQRLIKDLPKVLGFWDRQIAKEEILRISHNEKISPQ